MSSCRTPGLKAPAPFGRLRVRFQSTDSGDPRSQTQQVTMLRKFVSNIVGYCCRNFPQS